MTRDETNRVFPSVLENFIQWEKKNAETQSKIQEWYGNNY